MATRFELLLWGDHLVRLRALGEEALDEIDRIENLLSLYRPHTDIARINAAPAGMSVRVAPETLRLLQRARELSQLTGGTFDPTAGALIRAWGFHHGSGQVPDPESLRTALSQVGWEQMEWDDDAGHVTRRSDGLLLDLGAIGKGYALDRATERLREGGITCALLQGGTSSVVALGHPPDADGWKIALPPSPDCVPAPVFTLSNTSLSVSAPSGKGFVDADGQYLGHVLDPRTGRPVSTHGYVAVVTERATDSDALSTALLVGGRPVLDGLRKAVGDLRVWFGHEASAASSP